MESNSTTTHSGTSVQNSESRTITRLLPTLKPTDRQRLRTDPCSRSSRLGLRGQRAFGWRNFQVFYGHTEQQQEHPSGRHRSDWHTGVKQSSQLKLDSQATGWTIMTNGGMTKPCACRQTYQTKSGIQLNRDWLGTRTSWPSIIIPSQTQGLPSRRSRPKESNGCQQRSYPREAWPKLGRTLQNYVVAKERHIPPRDTRWAKATPSMKHRASKKILSVESDIRQILSLFTFC